MSFDLHTNFAYATVVTAPSPASSGTSLTVAAGLGALFAAVPANATVWPAGLNAPLSTNAEIVRVTGRSGDVLTIARAQEGTSARTILAGDQLAITMTAKKLTDVETAGSPPFTIANGSPLALNAALVEMIGVNPNGLLVLGGDVVLAKAVVATMDRDQLGIDSNALEIHGTAGAAPVRLEAFSFFNTDVSIDVIAQGAGTINLTAPVVASSTVTATDFILAADTGTVTLPAPTGRNLVLHTVQNANWDNESALLLTDPGNEASLILAPNYTNQASFGGGVLSVAGACTDGTDCLVELSAMPLDGNANGRVRIMAGQSSVDVFDTGVPSTGIVAVVGNGGLARLHVGAFEASSGVNVTAGDFKVFDAVPTLKAIITSAGVATFEGSVTAPNVIGPVTFPTSDPGIPGAWWNNAGTLEESV